jgi:phenylpyruvate tautomerase PptA (4-oxalocrotonate tautomerase family)
MPYLKIQTNLPHLKQTGRGLLKEASALVARELEKPEAYVMVALEDNTPMVFAGSDDPAAFLELRAIGLPKNKHGQLCKVLGELVSRHLGVPSERIFINFADIPPGNWGWKGDML